jgi:hypothetical protein
VRRCKCWSQSAPRGWSRRGCWMVFGEGGPRWASENVGISMDLTWFNWFGHPIRGILWYWIEYLMGNMMI